MLDEEIPEQTHLIGDELDNLGHHSFNALVVYSSDRFEELGLFFTS